MPINGVQVVSVPVSDVDRALTFYRDVLGFDVVSDVRMGPDMRWVQVRPVGSFTSLTLVTWFESMPAGSLRGLVFEVDDLDATLVELDAKGLSHSSVEDQPWGRFVTAEDPDGNGFIIQSTRQ